jgi:peptidoglycan hydrolase-like protein with peptidoglycan-binding domain
MKLGIRIRNAWITAGCGAFLVFALGLPATAREASTTTKAGSSSTSVKPKSKKHHAQSASSRRRKRSRVRGQQKIDSPRAQAIQEALIREHYFHGEANGKWDQASEEAMRRYQQDHGWQDKTVPDSRALIKLGLGPSNDHLLNPESAMTTVPERPKADPMPTTSHSSPAVANPPQAAAPSSTPVSSDTSRPQ